MNMPRSARNLNICNEFENGISLLTKNRNYEKDIKFI